MVELNCNVDVKQVVKITNHQTGEDSYLIMNEDKREWEQLSKQEYNKLRGYSNGE